MSEESKVQFTDTRTSSREDLVQIQEPEKPKDVTLDTVIDNIKESEKQISFERAQKAFEMAAAEVKKRMADMAASGKIFLLTPEEIDLLSEFRSFKKSLRKSSVFRWQTVPIDITNEVEGKVHGFIAQ